MTTFATELLYTLNCASEVFQDMAGIPKPLALGFQAIYCTCRYNKIYWRQIWNSHFLNTYLSLVSEQSSLNGSPLWGDTVCYTHGECPEVLRCPWDIKALKHQDAFPGEGKAVKLYGRLPEFCKTVKSACAARPYVCAIAWYKGFWKWQDKRKKGISMEQAWVGMPKIKGQFNKFLVLSRSQ